MSKSIESIVLDSSLSGKYRLKQIKVQKPSENQMDFIRVSVYQDERLFSRIISSNNDTHKVNFDYTFNDSTAKVLKFNVEIESQSPENGTFSSIKECECFLSLNGNSLDNTKNDGNEHTKWSIDISDGFKIDFHWKKSIKKQQSCLKLDLLKDNFVETKDENDVKIYDFDSKFIANTKIFKAEHKITTRQDLSLISRIQSVCWL
jgi:hypothetical protein